MVYFFTGNSSNFLPTRNPITPLHWEIPAILLLPVYRCVCTEVHEYAYTTNYWGLFRYYLLDEDKRKGASDWE